MPDHALPRDHWFIRSGNRVLRTLFRRIWGARCRGWEHLPRDGPCILVGNHPSYLDPVGLWAFAPRPVRFLAWDAAFRVFALRPFLRWSGAVPVDTDRPDLSAVRGALRVLRRGEVLGLFPEAERSLPGGRPKPFREAVFRMALSLDVPLLPVTTLGSWRIWPPGRLLPRLGGAMRFVVHPAVEPAAFRQEDDPPRALLLAVRRAVLAPLPAEGVPLDAADRGPGPCASPNPE